METGAITLQTSIGQHEIERLVDATRSTGSRAIEFLFLVPLMAILVYIAFPLSHLIDAIIALVKNDAATGAEKIELLNAIPGFWWMVALLVCFGFPFIIWLLWTVVKGTRRLFDNALVAQDTYKKYKAALTNVTYEFSEDGIKAVSGDGKTETYPWTDFKEAIWNDGLFFLVKGGAEPYMIIPAEDAESDGDKKRLSALIAAKVLNPKNAA